MRDKQIAPANTEPRIFLVSAVLHCVSMTALVYLRSSFGFGYLRPKSVFFAFSWAFTLYAIYAWMDGAAWREHRALILFGVGTMALYWFHLAVAFTREWRERGEHEQYSGLPHVVRLWRPPGNGIASNVEQSWRLWGEPTVVLIFSVVLGANIGAKGLAWWLCLVSCCLWGKEWLNRWFQLRSRKRQNDVFADTEEVMEPRATTGLDLDLPMSMRRGKVKRIRKATLAADESANK